MVQVPAETRVTVVPETVHTPVVALELKETLSPLVAVAATIKVPVPIVLPGNASNDIVWLTFQLKLTEPDADALAVNVEAESPDTPAPVELPACAPWPKVSPEVRQHTSPLYPPLSPPPPPPLPPPSPSGRNPADPLVVPGGSLDPTLGSV